MVPRIIGPGGHVRRDRALQRHRTAFIDLLRGGNTGKMRVRL